MALPAGVTTRTVTLGPGTTLEAGDALGVKVKIKASRDLVWAATGTAVRSVEKTHQNEAGLELEFPLPVTDQTGWLLDGQVVDVTGGKQSHYYVMTVEFYAAGSARPVSSSVIGPVSIPTGDLSPVDADLLIPAPTAGGATISLPDAWSQAVALAEAAAADAAAAVGTVVAGVSTALQELDLPADGSELSATSARATAPIAGRAAAGSERQPPLPVSSPAVTTPSVGGIIGMLADSRRKVVTNTGFSASQIGSTEDFVSTTMGKDFAGGSGTATGFRQTPRGEALVAVKVTNNSGPGTLRRSTGFNPDTMDATSWATALTASKNGAHIDGRWDLTPWSFAPLASPGAGAGYVAEYDGNLAWQSLDDGATWAQIFDLQQVRPGANHVHGIAYDRHDDRVWISIGDTSFAGIYYCNRDDIDGLNTPWTLLPGSNSAAWQVTTIVPLSGAVVFLSDASTSGVFHAKRDGLRGYTPLAVAVSLPGTGLIGAHAFQAAEDQPAYLSFYQSGASQTPRVVATIDGLHFSTVYTDAETVASGRPGVHSIVGPDLDGFLWAKRNMASGNDGILRVSALRPSSGVPTTRQVTTGPGITGGGNLTADRTLTAVSSQSPIRRGLVAHSGPEELFSSTSAALADGTLYLVKVVAENDAATATRNVRVYQVAAATGLTSWVAAVYDASGAQLGSTSASDAGSASSHRNLAVGSFALTKGAEYYVALLFKGTTGPTLARGSASAQVRMGLTGANLLYATGGTGLSDIPASIAPGSLGNLDIALWVGLL